MVARVSASELVLRQLYIEQEMTVAEVAVALRCSETTVRRRLAEKQIPLRARGPRPLGTVIPEWSAALAYSVGLLAADGNLSPDGRHITFVSADLDLHDIYKECLGISNQTGAHGSAFQTTFGDVRFYHWLESIGLMPNKTFCLGQVNVPAEFLADFVRGYLDGDGNINVYLDRYLARKHKTSRYEYWRLSVRFFCASREFLEWIHGELSSLLTTRGSILPAGHIWVLKYGKGDSMRLLRWLYYHSQVPRLERKWQRYQSFLLAIDLTV